MTCDATSFCFLQETLIETAKPSVFFLLSLVLMVQDSHEHLNKTKHQSPKECWGESSRSEPSITRLYHHWNFWCLPSRGNTKSLSALKSCRDSEKTWPRTKGYHCFMEQNMQLWQQLEAFRLARAIHPKSSVHPDAIPHLWRLLPIEAPAASLQASLACTSRAPRDRKTSRKIDAENSVDTMRYPFCTIPKPHIYYPQLSDGPHEPSVIEFDAVDLFQCAPAAGWKRPKRQPPSPCASERSLKDGHLEEPRWGPLFFGIKLRRKNVGDFLRLFLVAVTYDIHVR